MFKNSFYKLKRTENEQSMSMMCYIILLLTLKSPKVLDQVAEFNLCEGI